MVKGLVRLIVLQSTTTMIVTIELIAGFMTVVSESPPMYE